MEQQQTSDAEPQYILDAATGKLARLSSSALRAAANSGCPSWSDWELLHIDPNDTGGWDFSIESDGHDYWDVTFEAAPQDLVDDLFILIGANIGEIVHYEYDPGNELDYFEFAVCYYDCRNQYWYIEDPTTDVINSFARDDLSPEYKH